MGSRQLLSWLHARLKSICVPQLIALACLPLVLAEDVLLTRYIRLVSLFSWLNICMLFYLAQYPLCSSPEIPSLAFPVDHLHSNVLRSISPDTRATTLIRVVHPAVRADLAQINS